MINCNQLKKRNRTVIEGYVPNNWQKLMLDIIVIHKRSVYEGRKINCCHYATQYETNNVANSNVPENVYIKATEKKINFILNPTLTLCYEIF